jgi:hypothetical protein
VKLKKRLLEIFLQPEMSAGKQKGGEIAGSDKILFADKPSKNFGCGKIKYGSADGS